jgi:hypothetical protein
MLKAWLAHPLTSGLDIDDPTHLRQQIVQEKSSYGRFIRNGIERSLRRCQPVKEQCWKWERGGSGGISLRSLVPGWSFEFWRRLENAVGHWNNELALFAKIVLRRVD